MICFKLCFNALNQYAMFVKKHDMCNSHEGIVRYYSVLSSG